MDAAACNRSPTWEIGLKDNARVTRPAGCPSQRFWKEHGVSSYGANSRPLLLALALLAFCIHGAPRIERIVTAAAQIYGANAVVAVRAWGEMLDGAAALSEERKVRRINSFFNHRIAFEDDLVLWGQADFWATPLDTLARGGGDCEDFAIAKYVSLRMLGLADDKLRLIYVRAKIGGVHSTVSQAHMVLGYYPDPVGEPQVLDNLIDEVQPASRRSDLLPIFSFNADGLWTGATAAPAASATARLSRWRDVLARMRAQGFELGAR